MFSNYSKLQGDSKLLLGVSVAYNFQNGSNKIKLLMELETCLLRDIQDNKAVVSSPLRVLQHVRCNCVEWSNNSELQFTERGHSDLVSNVLNVSPKEEISAVISVGCRNHRVGPSRPIQRPGKCMWRNSRILPSFWWYTSLLGHHDLPGDLSTGVTDTSAPCPGISSLSLFLPKRKKKGGGGAYKFRTWHNGTS